MRKPSRINLFTFTKVPSHINLVTFIRIGKSLIKISLFCERGNLRNQENKVRQILLKTNNFYPLIRTRIYVYQGVRNVPFFENLAYFFFLVSSVLRFTLLPCYQSVSSRSCDMFRQHDGLRALCRHFKDSKDQNVLHKTTELFRIVLSYWR